jgi:hypothetical protein
MMHYQPYLEEVARFAAEGELGPELQRAKAEFTGRTGELFETDASFERRIAAFLEWYGLDRKISFRPELTPAELFLMQKGAALSEADRNRYAGLTQSTLSLYEYRKTKGDCLFVRDLFTGEKLQIHERRSLAGLESGDLLEARLIPFEGLLLFAESYYCLPRDARKEILAALKRFKKKGETDRLGFVHRVAYFANRSERYKHLKPRQIFAELNEKAA